MHTATKLVIITERSVLDGVAALLEEGGATGYTYVDAGGKGSRGKRQTRNAGLSGVMANVKIEVVVSDHDMAERILNSVAERYFQNYSGIAYVEPVEILRPHKFKV